MKKFTKRLLGSILLLVISLTVILSSLSSCQVIVYQANSKEEISQSITASLNNGGSNRKDVSGYLDDWKVPRYDRIKFAYFESCFNQLFNLEGGMPEVLTHAADTARLFLEHYYDEIDLENKTEVTDALLYCYVAAIGDPYSVYRPPVETSDYNTEMSGKFGGIGVIVEYHDADESIMINTVYPESPAEKAGIKVGDFIYAVDGVTVEEIGYLNAVSHVRGEIGTKVELTLIRGGEFVTVTATRAEVEEINVEMDFDSETGIAYISIVSFKENTFDQFKEAVDEVMAAGAKGIVFDLRNNPGGYVNSVCDVISYIIPSGHTILSYQYKGRKETVIQSYNEKDGSDHVIDLPITVLCNQYTASAGEIFTAAMRDYNKDNIVNAKIVGVNTYGKGIMQNSYYYTDDSSVTVTVAYYNPPCGVNYHGIGVCPDVIIEHSGDSDIQLLMAKSELLQMINDN